MNHLLINKKKINQTSDPYIIAEIGTNHNRDINIAKKMIIGLAKSGCNCVKFQIYESNEIVSKNIKASEYNLDKIYGNISAVKMFDKFLKTPKNWFPTLKNFVHKMNMDFAVTIHGDNGIKWAKKIKPDIIKIASMDHTNTPFLKKLINQIKAPILLSTGMAELKDIERAIKILKKHKFGFGIFHCCAIYPAKKNDLRLKNILYLKNKLKINVGFSDHSIGANASLEARKLGAFFFEKHVTLNPKLIGPDHSFAHKVKDFSQYIDALKLEKIKPNDIFFKFIDINKREKVNKIKYLKSLILKKSKKKYEIITIKDFYFARPGSGIPPYNYQKVLGLRLNKNLDAESILKWEDIK